MSLKRRTSLRRQSGGLNLVIVVLHKIFEGGVAPTGVEVVLLHLGVRLFKVPVVELKAINSAHGARAMTASGAVYEKLARRRIAGNFQEHRGCLCCRIRLVGHWNVDVRHSYRLDHGLLVILWFG